VDRELRLAAVGPRLAALELEVELGDLGDPQLTEGLRRKGNRGRGRLLPRLGAGANELDDLVDALGHGVAPFRRRSRRPTPPVFYSCTGASSASTRTPRRPAGGLTRTRRCRRRRDQLR